MAAWRDVLLQVVCGREDGDVMRAISMILVGVIPQGIVDCSALRDERVLPQHKRGTIEANVKH